MATTTLSIEEFIEAGYDREFELVDGEVTKRNVGNFDHSLIETLLAAWFLNHGRDWKIVCLIEMDVMILPTSLLRPDVTLVRPGAHPDRLTEPPLLVVEILSPSDTLRATQQKCEKYREMGVQDMWIIDPRIVRRTGFMWSGDQWIETYRLKVGGGRKTGTEIFVDLDILFKDLDESRQP
jgi:Uma2 family endonuclease